MNEPARKSTRPAGAHDSDGAKSANGTPSAQGVGNTTLAALIEDAVALHEALGGARSRTQRLIAALRRHRKQTRLMSSALGAIKQLRLQETAE